MGDKNYHRILTIALSAILATAVLCQTDGVTTRLVVQTGHTSYVQSAAFSRDGNLIVTSGVDGLVKLWHTASARELRTLAALTPDYVRAVAIAPDGTITAIASLDGLIIIETATGKVVRDLLTNPHAYHDVNRTVAFSPDGKTLALAGRDGVIELWDTHTWLKTSVLSGHSGEICSVAYSPAGTRIVSESTDGTFDLWDYERNTRIAMLTGAPGSCAATPRAWFSHDGGRVATWRPRVGMQIFDASDGRLIRGIPLRSDALEVAMADDLRTAIELLPNGSALAIDLNDGAETSIELTVDPQVPRRGVIFDPQNMRAAAFASFDGTLTVISPERKFEARLEGEGDAISSGAISPDGTMMVSAGLSGRLTKWDLDRDKPPTVVADTGVAEAAISFSADGKFLVADSLSSRKVVLLDARSGRIIRSFNRRSQMPYGAVFSPDFKLLALGNDVNEPGTIELRDTRTGALLHTLNGHARGWEKLVFRSDGAVLASTGSDGIIKFWRVSDGASLGATQAGYKISCLVFAPNTRVIAAGGIDGSVKLFEMGRARPLFELPKQDDAVEYLGFSPDGRKLATLAGGDIVFFWDLLTSHLDHKTSTASNAVLSELNSYVGTRVRTGDDKHTLDVRVDQHEDIAIYDVRSGADIARTFPLKNGEWVISDDVGRLDTNQRLDDIRGLHWVFSDRPMQPVALDLLMRQYFEPELLRRKISCTTGRACVREFRRLPAVSDINRARGNLEFNKIYGIDL